MTEFPHEDGKALLPQDGKGQQRNIVTHRNTSKAYTTGFTTRVADAGVRRLAAEIKASSVVAPRRRCALHTRDAAHPGRAGHASARRWRAAWRSHQWPHAQWHAHPRPELLCADLHLDTCGSPTAVRRK